MDKIKDKKIVGLIILLVIVILLSVITYIKNKQYIFKDEYKDNIFVEEETNEEREELAENNKKEISKEEANKIVVEIKGEVVNPDVYEMPEGSIIKDLIEKAGGLKDGASVDNINRAEQLHNHQLVIIGDKVTINNEGAVQGEISKSDNSLININTASADELENIPGIGAVKAESIVSYREENGDFKAIEDIMNVSGIGEKSFEKIKDKITL